MLPNPRTKPLHDEMIEILKKINYHGTVSKSHFQTLGGPSWGTIGGFQLLDLIITGLKVT